jgi:hypothetical protein
VGGVVLECVEEFAAGGVVEEFGVGVFGDGGGGVAEQFADDFRRRRPRLSRWEPKVRRRVWGVTSDLL